VDLPIGDDPYAAAAATFQRWRDEGAIVADEGPALWILQQDYTGPDGRSMTRRGFLSAVRVTDYGAGRIRPHERTHPGPKEDRLRLTRATRANLSPIFSLYSDPQQRAWEVLEPFTADAPWADAIDDEGTRNQLWRVGDPEAIASVQEALADAELLIADGHHRYETARAYADEIGGEGPHRYVLMCLVALQDPGLTVYPTHRLVKDTTPEQQEALAQVLRRDFTIEMVDDLDPSADDGTGVGEHGAGSPLTLGYLDAHFGQPLRLILDDQTTADAVLDGHSDAYRHLDAAVVEALLLKGPLELTDDDISHLHRFGYARTAEQARSLVQSGAFDLAFVLRPTPVDQVRAVAEAGESMPPKSTYFFPKLPTGLLFNPLS
jgi:uncharacterized protein (DUF1015 family)